MRVAIIDYGSGNLRSAVKSFERSAREAGAELAFTYQGEAFGKRVKPLAQSIGSDILIDCDVTSEEGLDEVFATLKEKWGKLDFVIHAIAYSNKDELQGRYVDTTLENFLKTMHISCYSFTSVMNRAKDLMVDGGSAVTLTYYGAEKVMPNYNVMGVAKAALEASTRYLAADLGPEGIRVNAISAGPMRTLAGAVIGGSRKTFKYNTLASPLRRSVELDELGGTALYLMSDLSSAVTGETHFVDCGFNITGMPEHSQLDKL